MEAKETEEKLDNPTKVEVGNTGKDSERKRINSDNIASENTDEAKITKKEPIVPYPVDSNYDSKILNVLKKQVPLRPKTVIDQEKFDITKNPGDIDKEEEEILSKEKKEVDDALKTEKELYYKLQKIRDSSLMGKTLISDPLALFHIAKKAYIDQYYKISDLFVKCSLYYNYRISLEYNKPEEQYFLFQTKEISPICQHVCCTNPSRNIKINIENFVINENEKENKEKLMEPFLYIRKNFRCSLCCCCSRPTFTVISQTTKFGKIIEKMSAGDPEIDIYDDNNNIIYIISCKGCACGYCCADLCCGGQKCATCDYFIYNNEKSEVLGHITKYHKHGKKIGPDYDQIAIEFPEQASCQDKVLITCAGLSILYLYYQHNANGGKCCGDPALIKQSEY